MFNWFSKVFHSCIILSGKFVIFSLSLALSLSLCFNGHFPGEPELAGVYWSKGWWRWWWQLDYWSYKSCKAPVKSSPPPTNQHPVFLQAGCPSCRPTNSVGALKGISYWHYRPNIVNCGLSCSRWGGNTPCPHCVLPCLRKWCLVIMLSLCQCVMVSDRRTTQSARPHWQS